jgi:hypothetical protein
MAALLLSRDGHEEGRGVDEEQGGASEAQEIEQADPRSLDGMGEEFAQGGAHEADDDDPLAGNEQRTRAETNTLAPIFRKRSWMVSKLALAHWVPRRPRCLIACSNT